MLRTNTDVRNMLAQFNIHNEKCSHTKHCTYMRSCRVIFSGTSKVDLLFMENCRHPLSLFLGYGDICWLTKKPARYFIYFSLV